MDYAARHDVGAPPAFPTLALVTIVGGFSFIAIQLLTDNSGLPYLYLLMMIQMTPFLFSFSLGRPNLIAYVLFNHFVTYSVAKYNQILTVHKIDYLYPAALIAIKELVISTLLIILAYFISRSLLMPSGKKTPLKLLQLTKRQLFIIGIYLLSHNFILTLIPRQMATLQFVGNTAAIILLLTAQAPGHLGWQIFFMLGGIFSAFVFFLNTGMLALLGSLGALFFFVFVLRRQLKPLWFLAVFAFIIIAIQPVKGAYRNMVDENPRTSTVQKASYLGELLAAKYFYGEEAYQVLAGYEEEEDTSSTLMKGFSRIGDDSLERVLAWTPSKVPFWGGETYQTIPYMFIPRFLWPGKPSQIVWNKFGRVYGFLSPDDYRTSVGVGYLAEGYMNFGYLGMYSVAIIMGLLIAFTERLTTYFLKDGYVFTFVCFLVPIMPFAGDLASILSSILIMACVIFIARPTLSRMIKSDIYAT